MFRSVFTVRDAWRVRIVALGCIVLFVGVSSQVLVNALAASNDAGTTTVKVTASAFFGKMADGNWSYAGACAVSPDQFSLGSMIALYNTDGSFNRQCTVEDSNPNIPDNQIVLMMPGNVAVTQKWGTQYLLVRVLRIGWGKSGPLLLPPATVILIAPLPPSHYPGQSHK